MTASPALRQRLRDIAARRLGLVIPPIHDSRLDQALAALDPSGEPAAFSALTALDTLPWDSDPWQRVIEYLTVGETCFLRHREWFAEIERHALAPLVAERRQRGLRRLRLWSAACSTGEEPYTLAMLVERLIPDRADWAITILATDLNASALATARRAVYRDWSLRELHAAERAEHFAAVAPNQYELKPHLRGMVTFRLFNLTEDLYPGPLDEFGDLDLILCRNVLMYWTPEVQGAAAARLCRCLAPGGWLALSPAEIAPEWYRRLLPVNFPAATLFRNLPAPAPATPRAAMVPLPPASARDAPRTEPGTDPGGAPSGAKLPASPASGSARRSIRAAAEAGRPRAAPASARRAAAPTGRSTGSRASPQPPDVPDALPAPQASPGADAIAEARTLADRGLLEMARRRCETILSRDSLDGEANLLLAAVCTELGELGPALEAARRAAYLVPRSAAAHFQLATTYRRLGHTALAQRAMETVLALLAPLPDDAPVALLAETTVAKLRQTARACLTGSGTAGSLKGGVHAAPR